MHSRFNFALEATTVSSQIENYMIPPGGERNFTAMNKRRIVSDFLRYLPHEDVSISGKN